jgi:hypothetical protein
MKRDNPKSAATRKPWFAALIGFAAGVLGGAGYLLWGGEYIFNWSPTGLLVERQEKVGLRV